MHILIHTCTFVYSKQYWKVQGKTFPITQSALHINQHFLSRLANPTHYTTTIYTCTYIYWVGRGVERNRSINKVMHDNWLSAERMSGRWNANNDSHKNELMHVIHMYICMYTYTYTHLHMPSHVDYSVSSMIVFDWVGCSVFIIRALLPLAMVY